MSYKKSILELREQGKSYDQIKKLVGCTKSTISYHCSKYSENERIKESLSLKKEINILWNDDELANIIFLIETGCQKRIIADAMRLSYSDFLSYCKKKSLYSKYLFGNNYSRIKQHRINKKILSVLYKGGKCIKCGYSKSYQALDFHHLKPEDKSFTISKNLNIRWSFLKNELDKCILLCANCHREHHDSFLQLYPG